MTAPVPAPIADALFTWPSDDPRLVGGACADCGAVAFPRPLSCSRCTSERIEEHLLARTGTLWSWTVQRFQPKEPYVGPEPFEPYGVGYVDLGEVIVESRLTTADPDRLEIGQTMELVIVPFTDTHVTFAFAPMSERSELRVTERPPGSRAPMGSGGAAPEHVTADQ